VSSHPAAALWYLTRTTARNRLRAQVARLRQPRYVIALLLGGAYLYWAVGVSARDPDNPFAKVGESAGAPVVLAVALLFTSAWWWLGRPDRTALAFSPAEVHLLFPAPLTRRALVHTKLLRAQAAILLNVLIWVVLLRGGAASVAGWQRGLALWILFSTFTLHRLASALVRLNAAQHAGAGWRRSALPAGVFAALFGGVAWVLWQGRAALTAAWAVGIGPTLDAMRSVLQQPVARVALAPVQALVSPVFAASPADWLLRIGPALLVLGLHYLWVVRTDAAFEEAALEASQERAKRLARMTGTQLSAKRSRKGGVPRIPPLPRWGPSAVTIAWKNMAAAIRGGGWSTQLATLFVIFAGTLVGLRYTVGLPATALLALTSVWGTMLLLLGPTWTRYDLRLDLRDLATLRTLPLSGRAIVSAEIVGVSLLHAVTVLVFFAVPALLVTFDPVLHDAIVGDLDAPLALVVAVVLLVPTINLLTFTIQNGLALLYPGWVQLGTDRRGFEAMGQTLLTAGLTLVGGTVALVFPVVLALASWFIARAWLGPWSAPVAAIVALLVLLAELVPLWLALGTVFDRTEPGDVPGQKT
jgi:hypothetical protein